MTVIKTKQNKTRQQVLELVEKLEPCMLLVRMQNGAAAMENGWAVSPEVENRITI